MTILFIRHSIALDRDEWEGSDMLRPLSSKGEKVALSFFKRLKSLYEIETIITSEAVRAKDTALILNSIFKDAKLIEDKRLNPDSTPSEIKSLILDYKKDIVIVGHEPTFSETISTLISDSAINIDIKKCALVEIEYSEKIFSMKNMLSPKLINRLGEA